MVNQDKPPSVHLLPTYQYPPSPLPLEQRITRDYKETSREGMLEISKWIKEREYKRLAVENTFKEINVMYITNLGISSIP